MWKALLLLVSTALCKAYTNGDFELYHVDVRNYTSTYSYDTLKSFDGRYTNSSWLRNPVEGYLYMAENISALAPPPFMPDSTWVAFVPSTLGYLSKPQADAIGSAGYSLLLVDGALQIDGDIVTKGAKVSLVIIKNATEFFTALPTNSMSIRVSVYPIGGIVLCYCGVAETGVVYVIIVALITIAIFGGCFCYCCYRYKMARGHARYHTVPWRNAARARWQLKCSTRCTCLRKVPMLTTVSAAFACATSIAQMNASLFHAITAFIRLASTNGWWNINFLVPPAGKTRLIYWHDYLLGCHVEILDTSYRMAYQLYHHMRMQFGVGSDYVINYVLLQMIYTV